jgi:hypothetical protein
MMFTRSVAFALAFLSGGVSAGVSLQSLPVENVNFATVSLFSQWAESHSKDYTTQDEAMSRLKIWIENHGRFVIQKSVLYCFFSWWIPNNPIRCPTVLRLLFQQQSYVVLWVIWEDDGGGIAVAVSRVGFLREIPTA